MRAPVSVVIPTWQEAARIGPCLGALGGAVGLGYVPCEPGETAAEMLASDYSIDVAGRIVPAEASLAPLYDPKSTRMRG